jgi:hypothetical protein
MVFIQIGVFFIKPAYLSKASHGERAGVRGEERRGERTAGDKSIVSPYSPAVFN